MALTERLRATAAETWERAVRHPFVIELGAGTLPADKFRRYFIQDYLFVDELRRVAALAVARAPDTDTARAFGGFLSTLLGAEDALFRKTFDGMEVSDEERRGVRPLPQTRAFGDFLVRTAYESQLPEICCALYVTEGVYLDWATRLRADGAKPSVAAYEDWIAIHDEEALGGFVRFLQERVDSAPLDAAGMKRIGAVFDTTLSYEVAFWDMAYGKDGT